ncbi:MAG: S8 family serine peptidase, partial [Rhodospirillales bacterium]
MSGGDAWTKPAPEERGTETATAAGTTAAALGYGYVPAILLRTQTADYDANLVPSDGLYDQQYALQDGPGGMRVNALWDEYTGLGVNVAIIDTGIDYLHPDLAPNYRADLDWDAVDNDSDAYASAADDDHGTAVAGVIAGAVGGGSMVGVAPGADITGLRVGFGANGTDAQFTTQLQNMVNFDVVNNSWGYGGYFLDSWYNLRADFQAIENAASNGRGGLGTVITFAAGNSAQSGDNVNYHNYQNSIYTIAVGATDADGMLADFSTPGAAVLVSAPGVGVDTSDRTGSEGYASGSYANVDGTSFSSPAVAGVVALMLEANPLLGYRDVQEILAYSARNSSGSLSGWSINTAGNWNGGGLTYHDGYGFGLVDAHGAVRLAETWEGQSTAENMATASSLNLQGHIIRDHSTFTQTVTIGEAVEIDQVSVDINLRHTWVGDLTITLTSPDGTTSTLVNRPGNGSASQDNITNFSLTSTDYWGENGAGVWTLRVNDSAQWDTGRLYNWRLNLHGDSASDNDTYIYTDEFSDVSGLATSSISAAAAAASGGAAPSEGVAPAAIIDKNAEWIEGEVIVKLRAGYDQAEAQSIAQSFGATVDSSTGALGIQLWKIDPGTTVEAAVAALSDNKIFEYVEPNYVIRVDSIEEPDATPDDPSYSQLWGLNNTGQTGGTADADIDAPEAWDYTTGGSVVVGVIDTGVDWSHPDLAANMWRNTGEIAGNGIDDDGNGYVDDYYGYDFVNNDGNPYDDHYHGTHVAGTIAASGDNGTGVTGVAWTAEIMALKFLSSSGSGTTYNAIRAVEYATQMGADITNNSWGGGGYSSGLRDAIAAAGDAGSVFIAAAGNSSVNTDSSPHYPSSYDLSNVISVASTDHNDSLSWFSNYGRTSVDLAAPGSSIYSTSPGNGYRTLSGTSMATPHVAGVAALLLSMDDTLTPEEIRTLLMDSVDPVSALSTRVASGGRLNAEAALEALGAPPPPPPPPPPPEVSRTNLTDDGGIDTINAAAVTSNSRIDLSRAQTSLIDGVELTITAGTDIENVYTGDGNDVVIGNGLDNTLHAGRGDDTISGGGGNDVLYGEAGNDTLVGGSGQDTLIGGAGDDLIYGGSGNDTVIFAGQSWDFTFLLAGDSLRVDGEGQDWLHEVEYLEFDDIVLSVGDLQPPPVAVDDSLSGTEDTALVIDPATLLANDSDPEDDPISITAVGNALGGTVAFDGSGNIVFTPTADHFGTATFNYTVSDGRGGHAQGTVSIDLAATPDAPVATPTLGGTQINEDTVTDFSVAALLADDRDPDGDALSITAVGSPTGGTVELLDTGFIRFTPTADYFGTAGFEYTLTDATGLTTTGSETFTIRGVNDTPTAGDDAFATDEDTPLIITAAEFLANDVDPDGDTLNVGFFSNPAFGTLQSLGGGQYLYTPDANFNGTDTFTYRVFDDWNAHDQATVTISVAAQPDAPVAMAGRLRIDVDETISWKVGARDIDTPQADLSYEVVSTVASGTLSFAANGRYTYTPDAGFAGTDSFSFRAWDGLAWSDPGTIDISIAEAGAPVASTPEAWAGSTGA